MAMTTAQVRTKLLQIRDNILTDLATDSGEKFRIAAYDVGNGSRFTYSTRDGALTALRDINAMIAALPGAQAGFLQLARVGPVRA